MIAWLRRLWSSRNGDDQTPPRSVPEFGSRQDTPVQLPRPARLESDSDFSEFRRQTLSMGYTTMEDLMRLALDQERQGHPDYADQIRRLIRHLDMSARQATPDRRGAERRAGPSGAIRWRQTDITRGTQTPTQARDEVAVPPNRRAPRPPVDRSTKGQRGKIGGFASPDIAIDPLTGERFATGERVRACLNSSCGWVYREESWAELRVLKAGHCLNPNCTSSQFEQRPWRGTAGSWDIAQTASVDSQDAAEISGLTIAEVTDAAHNQRKIASVLYRARTGGPHWRDLEIHHLGPAYFDAYCHSVRDRRTFRRDRILEIRLTTRPWSGVPIVERSEWPDREAAM